MSEWHDDPDADLLEQAGLGDQRAALELLRRRLPSLLALAEQMLNDRAEAEDVVQETFERLWKKAGKWQRQARLSTYMYKIALNLCRDRLRKARPLSLDEIAEPGLPNRMNNHLQDQQTARAVRLALSGLPERQRAAIILSHYEELSNPEAASVLGVSVGALESLLARGRKRLRALLLDQHAELTKV